MLFMITGQLDEILRCRSERHVKMEISFAIAQDDKGPDKLISGPFLVCYNSLLHFFKLCIGNIFSTGCISCLAMTIAAIRLCFGAWLSTFLG